MSKYVASRIFSSLADDPRPWVLSRTLRSDNPADLNGELRGRASFRLLNNNTRNTADGLRELLYREEGDMPGVGGGMAGAAGLRWTKKYIWRLTPWPFLMEEEDSVRELPMEQTNGGRLSVWFVKAQKPVSDSTSGAEDTMHEADYIFHGLDIIQFDSTDADESCSQVSNATIPSPPPPAPVREPNTQVVIARGQHLCVNDRYQTVYAFRMGNDPPGRILSWSSRHLIRGPKKRQDIVNLYSRDD
ncbi:hypothetical protein ACJ72_04117 [Emergomyces africanus]|uniref:DUF6314 domain-containing protein n=1 Tax=Emergomyces africanus TaxID=1955775 RepID=A0A1B7NXL9_9EURO|nr:hypothetical protein ACJ72_04117 [Emergomyces africanus]